MRIASLYRYPVKGLSPESVSRAVLERQGYFPGDRLFAIENGPSGFDPGRLDGSAGPMIANAARQY